MINFLKNKYVFPIDLVYLWVDGSDENWIKKKNEELSKSKNISEDVVAKGRFCDNNELKYSLRSVEKYIPWVNKIFIVTDNQIPSWLNLNHPKIKIIDHKDIMPPEALPCFNSSALETRLAYIPGLLENFLYANDDCFINKPLNKEFFFVKENIPKIRFNKRKIDKLLNLYEETVLEMQKKIENKFGYEIKNTSHHNIDAYTKSQYLDCIHDFKSDFDKTTLSKFRNKDDIQRTIIMYHSIAKNNWDYKIVKKIDRELPLIKKIINYIFKKYEIDSISTPHELIDWFEKRLKEFNPKLFCINDSETTVDIDRIKVKNFLEKFYPDKSSFEI